MVQHVSKVAHLIAARAVAKEEGAMVWFSTFLRFGELLISSISWVMLAGGFFSAVQAYAMCDIMLCPSGSLLVLHFSSWSDIPFTSWTNLQKVGMLGIWLVTLLWLVPAVWRAGSWRTPLRYPILSLVVGNTSLLSMHPAPKPCAGAYLWVLLRFAISSFMWPWINAKDPPAWRGMTLAGLIPAGAIPMVPPAMIPAGAIPMVPGGIARLVSGNWNVILFNVMIKECQIPLLLGLIVLLMIHQRCHNSNFLTGCKNEVLIDKVISLAEKVDHVLALDAAACREGLEQLKQDHPSIEILSRFDVCQDVLFIHVDTIMDIVSIATAFLSGQSYLGWALTFLFIWSLRNEMMKNGRALAGKGAITQPFQGSTASLSVYGIWRGLLHYVKTMKGAPRNSWERGAWDPDLFEILLSEKAQEMPLALALSLGGMCYSLFSKSHESALMFLMISLYSLWGLSKFIFTQWDLGVERFAEQETGNFSKSSTESNSNLRRPLL